MDKDNWNLVAILCIKKYTTRGILWHCHGNNLSSSLFLLWTKYYHLWLYKCHSLRECHSCKKETWRLNCCHSNITIRITDNWSWISDLIIIIIIIIIIISIYLPPHFNHVWRHHLFPFNLTISRTREDFAKKKFTIPFHCTLSWQP